MGLEPAHSRYAGEHIQLVHMAFKEAPSPFTIAVDWRGGTRGVLKVVAEAGIEPAQEAYETPLAT